MLSLVTELLNISSLFFDFFVSHEASLPTAESQITSNVSEPLINEDQIVPTSASEPG